MPNNNNLFSEFSPTTAEQWIQQIIKDLKGESYDQKLLYTNLDGIIVKPFYSKEDSQNKNLDPLFNHTDWDITQEFNVKNDELIINKKTLQALNNGVASLVFYVSHTVNLIQLLQNIQIEYINVSFVIKENTNLFLNNLNNYLAEKKIDANSPNITINSDPIANLIESGAWEKSLQEDKATFVSLLKPNKNTFYINANTYSNAGATEAYEIACTLAHTNAYINWLIENNIAITKNIQTINLNVSVGANYFFEIAKLRAYRKVFFLLFNEYELTAELKINAQTAFRNLTVADAYNNLLRATTEAMAATIGGCNSLIITPFNITYETPNDFSERLAQNIQLILKNESYFDKVADASAGSYFVEELTEQIAQKAWLYFTQIEKEGGFIAALEKTTIQNTIKEMATAQQNLFDEGKLVLIGTNKFPNKTETIKQYEKTISHSIEKKIEKIQPIITSRLSEKLEQERIKQEKTNKN